MAICHNLAGQHGKREAKKRATKIFFFLTVTGFYIATGIGTAYGFMWARHGVWVALGGVVFLLCALVATMFFSKRWISRSIDSIAKERIQYFRGGQAEAYVAWMLKTELDDGWHVFNNVKLENGSDNDHVVVGPGGVFSISTKSARGWFVGQPPGLKFGLLHNYQPCEFAVQAQRQAMNLVERLRAMMGANVPWVQPLLAVPFGYVDGDALGGKVIVAHAEDLTDRIAPPREPPKLSKAEVERTVQTMKLIAADAAKVYARPNSREA